MTHGEAHPGAGERCSLVWLALAIPWSLRRRRKRRLEDGAERTQLTQHLARCPSAEVGGGAPLQLQPGLRRTGFDGTALPG